MLMQVLYPLSHFPSPVYFQADFYYIKEQTSHFLSFIYELLLILMMSMVIVAKIYIYISQF